jgi:hypothetical protein
MGIERKIEDARNSLLKSNIYIYLCIYTWYSYTNKPCGTILTAVKRYG